MSHRQRNQSEANIYHVCSRGVGRQIIFEDDVDRAAMFNAFKAAGRELSVEVLAWCFMDNHIHLLLRAPIEVVSVLMKRVLSLYAVGFNERHGRVGHLFQGRFLSEPVSDEAYVLQAVRYIHQNPQKAGVAPTNAYVWSSYSEYVSAPRLASPRFILDLLGSVDEFIRFHREDGSDAFLEPEDDRRGAAFKCALRVAFDELGEAGFHSIGALPREERDRALGRLRSRGLTVRQIERLTGISRSVVARAQKWET